MGAISAVSGRYVYVKWTSSGRCQVVRSGQKTVQTAAACPTAALLHGCYSAFGMTAITVVP